MSWAVFSLGMCFSSLLITATHGRNTIFYTLVLVGVIGALARMQPCSISFGHMARRYWPLHLALAAPLFATLIHQVGSGNYVIKEFDMPSRLACFIVLSWVFLAVPDRCRRWLVWGIAAGAVAGSVALIAGTNDGANRADIYLTPIIPYGDTVLTLGAMGALSINWDGGRDRRRQWLAILLKIVVGVLVLFSVYLSRTRGSWIALPLYILLASLMLRSVLWRYKMLAIMLCVAAASILYFSSAMVKARMDDVNRNLVSYVAGGDMNTSIGIRLQLWRASWQIFAEHPVIGVGAGQFHAAMEDMAKQGIVTSEATIFPHSHNDILYSMATLGLAGMIATIALYLAPWMYFLRAFRSDDVELRTAAGMGLALVGGFFIFGCTDVMFFGRTVSHTFYSAMLAMVFAHVVARGGQLSAADAPVHQAPPLG